MVQRKGGENHKVFKFQVSEAEITPGVTEMEDGSAIIGEMQEEIDTSIPVPFNANLAEFIDDDDLRQ